MYIISNVDIDMAGNLRLTDIKKYSKLTSQIKKEINELYKDYILALAVFVNYSQKIYDNVEVTENMKVSWDKDFGWVLSLLVQLHGSIYYWKIDEKDVIDVTKLVRKFVWYLLV